MKTARYIPILAVAIIGCSHSVLPESAQPVADVEDFRRAAFPESKPVVFRSWNGRWIGTDCDTEIELRPDGSARLTEFGYALSEYDGAYTIEAPGGSRPCQLSLSLPSYGNWPEMSAYIDGGELLVVPTDGNTGYIFGKRGGSTIRGGQGTFWPFRQVERNARP